MSAYLDALRQKAAGPSAIWTKNEGVYGPTPAAPRSTEVETVVFPVGPPPRGATEGSLGLIPDQAASALPRGRDPGENAANISGEGRVDEAGQANEAPSVESPAHSLTFVQPPTSAAELPSSPALAGPATNALLTERRAGRPPEPPASPAKAQVGGAGSVLPPSESPKPAAARSDDQPPPAESQRAATRDLTTERAPVASRTHPAVSVLTQDSREMRRPQQSTVDAAHVVRRVADDGASAAADTSRDAGDGQADLDPVRRAHPSSDEAVKVSSLTSEKAGPLSLRPEHETPAVRAPSPTIVEVKIGRIDVRQPASSARAQPAPRRPAIGLAEYLSRRRGSPL